MTDHLKKRLTGAVALLLLGVVGWFWLLSADSPIDDVASETEIPAAPAFERFAVAQPQPPQGIDPAPAQAPPLPDDGGMGVVERAPEPAAAPAVAKPATPPVAAKPAPAPAYREDAKGLPASWALQVAALSNAAAAEKLKGDLAARGHKAYTRVSGNVTRVFVGPKLSREQVAADKQAIDKAFRVNSIIVRFEPE